MHARRGSPPLDQSAASARSSFALRRRRRPLRAACSGKAAVIVAMVLREQFGGDPITHGRLPAHSDNAVCRRERRRAGVGGMSRSSLPRAPCAEWPRAFSATSRDHPSRSGVVLGEALRRHLVRERQPDADRQGGRPVVSALPALDDPGSFGAMNNSGVVRTAHASLLLSENAPSPGGTLSTARLRSQRRWPSPPRHPADRPSSAVDASSRNMRSDARCHWPKSQCSGAMSAAAAGGPHEFFEYVSGSGLSFRISPATFQTWASPSGRVNKERSPIRTSWSKRA